MPDAPPIPLMRLVLVAVLFFTAQPVAVPQGTAASIEGKVLRLGTGEPIVSAWRRTSPRLKSHDGFHLHSVFISGCVSGSRHW
jgi:hypothetical protein